MHLTILSFEFLSSNLMLIFSFQRQATKTAEALPMFWQTLHLPSSGWIYVAGLRNPDLTERVECEVTDMTGQSGVLFYEEQQHSSVKALITSFSNYVFRKRYDKKDFCDHITMWWRERNEKSSNNHTVRERDADRQSMQAWSHLFSFNFLL